MKIKATKLVDIVAKDNKFAKKYKAELTKKKKEAVRKLREAELDIEGGRIYRKKKQVNYGERLTRIAVWFALVSFVAMIAAQVYLAL